MKIALLILLSILILHPSAFPQGSLTPPGAPAPTMKTLDEVEPRINIQRTINPLPTDANNHYIINATGSYYLSANVDVAQTNGIHVTVEGVTIDLNGFEIHRIFASNGAGILIDAGAHRCTVKNGSIKGFDRGIQCANAARGGSFLQVAVTGCAIDGLLAGSNWQVEGCKAHDNPGNGISASVGSTLTNCTASNNGTGTTGSGILAGTGALVGGCSANGNKARGISINNDSTVRDCTAGSNGDNGITVFYGSVVIGCTANGNTFNGISAGDACTISKCTVGQNRRNGISVANACTVEGNTAQSNATDSTSATPYAGIVVTGSGNRIDSNNMTNQNAAAAARGLIVTTAGSNLVVRNSAFFNTGNYSIVAGNKDAQILSVGTGFVSTDPWANFQ